MKHSIICCSILLGLIGTANAGSLTLRAAPESNYSGLDAKVNQYGITYSGENSDGENYIINYMYAKETSDSIEEVTRHDFQYLWREQIDSYYKLSGYRVVIAEDREFDNGLALGKQEMKGIMYEYGYGKYWQLGEGHGIIANGTVALGVGQIKEEYDDDEWVIGAAVDASLGYSYSFSSGSLYLRYRLSGVPSKAATNGPEFGVSFHF